MLTNIELRDALDRLGIQNTAIKKYCFEYELGDVHFYVKRNDDRVIETAPLVIDSSFSDKRHSIDSLSGISCNWEPRKSTAYSKFPRDDGTDSPFGYDLDIESTHSLEMLLDLLRRQNPVVGASPVPEENDIAALNVPNEPLNQILYGPPGTGKTYQTINKALAICDPEFLSSYRDDRGALKARFDSLVEQERVQFVTFHQSYGYEEFVQGIRARTENGQVKYSVESGIFKRISDLASRSADRHPTDWLQVGDSFNGCDLEELTSEIAFFRKRNGKRLPMPREVIDTITELVQNHGLDVANTDGEELEQKGTQIEPYFVTEYGTIHRNIAQTLIERMPISETTNQPYVLIIDEINRGNIAKIFGELITLLEPSKRVGAKEQLQVRLPYGSDSEPLFGVPDNLYVLGTMNTADRSLALLDTALRRRFDFVEMAPDPSVLESFIVSEAGVDLNLRRILSTMNERIEALYDREHCLGHAFFIPVLDAIRRGESGFEKLTAVFREKIIPLLEEYFFEDWSKMRLVLGDNQKSNIVEQFITEIRVQNEELFGEIDDDIYHDIGHSQFSIQKSAFDLPNSYLGIYE